MRWAPAISLCRGWLVSAPLARWVHRPGGVREGAPSSVLAHLCYTLPVTATIIVHWAWVFGIYPILCQVTPEIIALTLWYSVAAVGIAIVNDFKSVEGDDLIRKLHSTGLP